MHLGLALSVPAGQVAKLHKSILLFHLFNKMSRMQTQVIEAQPPPSPMAWLFIDCIREVAKIAHAKHPIGHRLERCTSELASVRCYVRSLWAMQKCRVHARRDAIDSNRPHCSITLSATTSSVRGISRPSQQSRQLSSRYADDGSVVS